MSCVCTKSILSFCSILLICVCISVCKTNCIPCLTHVSWETLCTTNTHAHRHSIDSKVTSVFSASGPINNVRWLFSTHAEHEHSICISASILSQGNPPPRTHARARTHTHTHTHTHTTLPQAAWASIHLTTHTHKRTNTTPYPTHLAWMPTKPQFSRSNKLSFHCASPNHDRRLLKAPVLPS